MHTDTHGGPHVVVVGSGARLYREYAFRSLASRYEVSAILPGEPTWQLPYLSRWAVADLSDAHAVARAATNLAGRDGSSGLFTWDETVLETTAAAAELVHRPHMSPEAAARCRDKHRTRTALDAAGIPSVAHALTRSDGEAERVAEAFGYPVVLKPRALAGSMGVSLAHGAEDVRRAFAIAAGASYATLPTGSGVLVEEYLDGPEVSVDSAVTDGRVRCVHVARKRLGFAPQFEEVGHLIGGWDDVPAPDALRDLVVRAHAALGVDHGITHAEARHTVRGWRLIELNGRLGGDLIPLIGRLATGVDLVTAAAEISLGRVPDVTARHRGAAEVRFLYLPTDGVVQHIDLGGAGSVPGIHLAVALTEPGTVLRLPPRDAIPRVAALVAASEDAGRCASILEQAEACVSMDHQPLGVAAEQNAHVAV
jgi:ATP-grasp domain